MAPDGTVMPRGSELRTLLRDRDWSQADAARYFGVSRAAVSQACREGMNAGWWLREWPWPKVLPEHCGRLPLYDALVAYTEMTHGIKVDDRRADAANELLGFLDHNGMVVGYDPRLHRTAGWYLRDRTALKPTAMALKYLVWDRRLPAQLGAA